MTNKFICFVCGILLALFSFTALMSMMSEVSYAQGASDLITLKVDASSKAEMPQDAEREITAQAVADVAREQVVQSIGNDRYQKNKVAIDQRVVKQASRFIPFANASQPIKQADGSWKSTVEVKLSLSSLRRMLSDNGFSARTSETPANVLPLIALTDRTKSVSLRWWLGEGSTPDQKSLIPVQKLLHDKLKEEFEKQKVALILPPTSSQALPDVVKAERPSQAELISIGGIFKAAMIARGDVRIMSSKDVSGAAQVSVKIQVIEAASPDRVVAEVSRDFTTDPLANSVEAGIRARANVEFAALATDLAEQVKTAWQRGIVGTNFMRLAVRGKLGPIQVASFKSQLQRSVREIRDVKERLFDRDSVTFEIDYAGDAAHFANRFKSLQLPGFESKLAQVDAAGTSLTLDVRATATP